MSLREPIEPPGGFTPKSRPDDLSSPELKPDWLVGADDGIDLGKRPEGPRPALSRPSAPPGQEPPPRRPPVKRPTAAQPPEAQESGPEAWAPAASSIPKLTVVPRRERPEREAAEEEELDIASPLDSGLEGEESEGEGEAPVATAPEDPWWLVVIETIATNRVLQIALGAVAVALLAWTFWPRQENASTSIAAIKHHPQRYEGQSVRVRGVVVEVFDVGSNAVFQLRQGRDTLVVFSPGRRPTARQRVMVQGTVSTGYLDGRPRVALFEAPGAVTP